MWSHQATLVILIIFGLQQYVDGNLTLSGVKCGDFTCKRQEYCNFDRRCLPCTDICDPKTHNRDEKLCVSECQDYLHDLRYVKTEDVSKLYALVVTTLTLLILLIIVLLGILCYKIFKWQKTHEISAKNVLQLFKKSSSDENKSPPPPNGIVISSGKTNLRLEIPSPDSQSDSPPTMTTSISRRPAEDSALDYAYDNHAMSSTPSPHHAKPTRESNF